MYIELTFLFFIVLAIIVTAFYLGYSKGRKDVVGEPIEELKLNACYSFIGRGESGGYGYLLLESVKVKGKKLKKPGIHFYDVPHTFNRWKAIRGTCYQVNKNLNGKLILQEITKE